MSNSNQKLQVLLADASNAYNRLGALYFNAKMSGVHFPIISDLLFVATPSGYEWSQRNTIDLIEPVILARNPEWIQNPDNIPQPLKDARRKGNAGNHLLHVAPPAAVAEHREKSREVAREVGRLLDKPDLVGALDSPNAERRVAAERALSSQEAIQQALEVEGIDPSKGSEPASLVDDGGIGHQFNVQPPGSDVRRDPGLVD